MEEKIISGLTLGTERALYGLRGVRVENCIFDGPEDGESALKECRDFTVDKSEFHLRYPLWHGSDFRVTDCGFDEGVRAALWYSERGSFENCRVRGVKFMRECADIRWTDCTVVSPEFGWKCRNVEMSDCDITSEYFLFECTGGRLDWVKLRGKYSFQYTKDLTVSDSALDTKDAFWHSENVTVVNSTVKGEYLGWYSKNLTLIGCRIIGTQPLCYCEGLRLIDCTMENCDLAFEYSDVEAQINGTVDSVKNPRSGHITADGYGEIILADSVIETACEIAVRGASAPAGQNE